MKRPFHLIVIVPEALIEIMCWFNNLSTPAPIIVICIPLINGATQNQLELYISTFQIL